MNTPQAPKPDANALANLLYSKYAANPQKFCSDMPDVAQMLDAMNPPRRRLHKSTFGLTAREVKRHQDALTETLAKAASGDATAAEAIKGLERCAFLIKDDSLPSEANYETLSGLLKAAVGKRPASFKKSAKIAVADDQPSREVISEISLVKGVLLGLDREMRLISISVSPHKVRQRRKMLAFVGIGQDTKTDVAMRHDEYLSEIEPHGA